VPIRVAEVVPLRTRATELADIIDSFLTRYTTKQSRQTGAKDLRSLFAATGASHPNELTEAAVLAWCQGPGTFANNTVRGRMSAARTFLRWCKKHNLADLDMEEEFAVLRKSFPATYGKKQGYKPARWLSKDEAFGPLITACQDNTWLGSRDQLVIRLGLLGLRCEEIITATWGWLQPDGTLLVAGKGHRIRHVHPGTTLTGLLKKWRRKYENEIGRPVNSDDPLICRAKAGRMKSGEHAKDLLWGAPIQTGWTVRYILHLRSELAELGHVAPHDLRRTAAGILHKERTADGAHRFDLRDIQRVLGHARADTTERVYLSDLDRDAQERAATILD
jgi:integrase